MRMEYNSGRNAEDSNGVKFSSVAIKVSLPIQFEVFTDSIDV